MFHTITTSKTVWSEIRLWNWEIHCDLSLSPAFRFICVWCNFSHWIINSAQSKEISRANIWNLQSEYFFVCSCVAGEKKTKLKSSSSKDSFPRIFCGLMWKVCIKICYMMRCLLKRFPWIIGINFPCKQIGSLKWFSSVREKKKKKTCENSVKNKKWTLRKGIREHIESDDGYR